MGGLPKTARLPRRKARPPQTKKRRRGQPEQPQGRHWLWSRSRGRPSLPRHRHPRHPCRRRPSHHCRLQLVGRSLGNGSRCTCCCRRRCCRPHYFQFHGSRCCLPSSPSFCAMTLTWCCSTSTGGLLPCAAWPLRCDWVRAPAVLNPHPTGELPLLDGRRCPPPQDHRREKVRLRALELHAVVRNRVLCLCRQLACVRLCVYVLLLVAGAAGALKKWQNPKWPIIRIALSESPLPRELFVCVCGVCPVLESARDGRSCMCPVRK